MTISTTERTTENICPPGCMGHVGTGYERDWAEGTKVRPVPSDSPFAGTRIFRDHCDHGVLVDNVNVMLVQRENQGGYLEPSVVAVSLDLDSTDLTPAQAREIAAALISAAEQAEARA